MIFREDKGTFAVLATSAEENIFDGEDSQCIHFIRSNLVRETWGSLECPS